MFVSLVRTVCCFLLVLTVTLMLGPISISPARGSSVPVSHSDKANPANLLAPTWSKSYQLYGYPHAIWLTGDTSNGINLAPLGQALNAAKEKSQVPEFVVYAIPDRDLSQSSRGGFEAWGKYLTENRLIAEKLQRHARETGIQPVVYLEPDSIAHAVQRLRSGSGDLYARRTGQLKTLVSLYKKAGAKVYLDAAHSGWFDYGDNEVRMMAQALNAAGIGKADGFAINISNRQKIGAENTRSETRYIRRLLPLLNHPNPEVVVDTSRNGGSHHPRIYYLRPDGVLADNGVSYLRTVGHWQRSDSGEIILKPLYGKPVPIEWLVHHEQYTFDGQNGKLTAPEWLDPVGNPQPGAAPSDQTRSTVIQKFRFIKPPDECDGSLNCPPGQSRHEIDKHIALHRLNQKPSRMASR